MADASKLLAPRAFTEEAAALLRRAVEDEDDAVLAWRFDEGLRSAIVGEPLGEASERAVAFALSVERAVFCIPRDPARRCPHAHLPWGEITASLPHGTVYCADPGCVAKFADPRRIVMDERCDLCEAEGSFTQLGYPLRMWWRVAMNICDGCAAWAPAPADE